MYFKNTPSLICFIVCIIPVPEIFHCFFFGLFWLRRHFNFPALNQLRSSYLTEATIETNGCLTADRKMTFSGSPSCILIIFCFYKYTYFHDSFYTHNKKLWIVEVKWMGSHLSSLQRQKQSRGSIVLLSRSSYFQRGSFLASELKIRREMDQVKEYSVPKTLTELWSEPIKL